MNTETYWATKSDRLADAALERVRKEAWRKKHNRNADAPVPSVGAGGEELSPVPNRKSKRAWGVRATNKHGYKFRERLAKYGASHWLPQAIQARHTRNERDHQAYINGLADGLDFDE